MLAPQHMAHLGGELFSRYLIAVEVAGTLLLVALVGAVAIVAEAAKSDAAPRQDRCRRGSIRGSSTRSTCKAMAPPARRGAGRTEVLHG